MNHRPILLRDLRYVFPLRNRHPAYRQKARELLRILRCYRMTRSQRIKHEKDRELIAPILIMGRHFSLNPWRP